MLKIISAQNPRIKSIVQLRKKRERDKTGLIIIEGWRELSLALQGGITIEEIYLCLSLINHKDKKPLAGSIENQKVTTFEINHKVFSKIAYRGDSGGVIAIAKAPDQSLTTLPEMDNPLYVVMDKVEKPGNLGAVLRSSDGAGVTAVIISDEYTDLWNSNVIRASLGAVFTVPIAVTNSGEAILWLRDRGSRIIVSTPSTARDYANVDFTGSCAIIVGSEDSGASDTWLKAADIKVRIPMLGTCDSLNVSSTASILMYEALRQRSSTE